MPPLIFVSPYLRGGSAKGKAHLANNAKYIATREGVELVQQTYPAARPTKKQTEYISRLLRAHPESKELMEYEAYHRTPNRKTATELIEQIWELYIEPMDRQENYVDYVSHRPGVQSDGDHGLWGSNGKVLNLSQAVAEVSNHPGVVWVPVISLRREDAERLGYTDVESWRNLINSSIQKIAKGYKIKPENLRWYAALHQKDINYHVHLLIFSTDPKEGYLTENGIRMIKSELARHIFRQDNIAIYEKQTRYRGRLGQDAEQVMEGLLRQMRTGPFQNERLEQLTNELAQRLRNTKGKKVYGYLPPQVKRIVDAIVDELAKDPRVAEAYSLWQDMRDEVVSTYTDQPAPRKPLSQEKEFKSVRNMVIREVLKFSDALLTFDDRDMEDEPEEPEEESEQSTQRPSANQQTIRFRSVRNVIRDEGTSDKERRDAVRELEKLWEEGFDKAAYQLGRCYRDGIGVSPDNEMAIQWFHRGAEAGDVRSEYALGKLLLHSDHPGDGYKWLTMAAKHGSQSAQYLLGKALLQGDRLPKYVDGALAYLTAAAERGNQYAQYTLGKLYLMGQEVPEDKELAEFYLSQSAAQGNLYARYYLDHLDDWRSATVGECVLRLLYNMSRIFEENPVMDATRMGLHHIDKKRRRELQRKRIAAGHKPDDHEDYSQQTM